MPLIIPQNLPAFSALENENVFVMHSARAVKQDIRPLKIVLVNLMPTKIKTEIQIARVLANSPLQVELSLVHMSSHESKNVPTTHLQAFYKTFEQIKSERFDGMIITGAPVEKMEFEQVDYWQELCEIMKFSNTNVYSTMHICWGAQAGLYYHYGIQKSTMSSKLFGVFEHRVTRPKSPLMRGFDEVFYVPHSRHTTINEQELINCKHIRILAKSNKAGVHMAATDSGRKIFVFGHMEYDKYTLKDEYDRDIEKGIEIDKPENYFYGDNQKNDVVFRWRAHAQLLFSNWLNYYVYQSTPFALEDLNEK